MKKKCEKVLSIRIDNDTFTSLSVLAESAYRSGSVSRLVKFIIEMYLDNKLCFSKSPYGDPEKLFLDSSEKN